MAQPVGLLAVIKITESNYKSFFKTKAITLISEEIYNCIHSNEEDYYFYQYNKKKEELLCLAFYNHGNRETVTGQIYQGIKEITPLALDFSYIALTLDAYNWTEVDTYERLISNKWQQSTITTEDLLTVKSIALACFDQFDQPFVEKLFSSKIVDSNMVKKVSALQEKHRLANLSNFAKDATPLLPIHLFGNYYYNGHVVFSCKSGGHIYPDVDLHTFKPTVYGAADDSYVLFGNHCIKTNPKKFKRVSKYEMVYYLSEDGVLEDNGQLIVGSDATTFKFVTDSVAEDSNYLYYYGQVISKATFNTYRIEEHPYHTLFIITDKEVYYNGYKIDVDGTTFSYKARLEHLAYGYLGIVGQDSQGLFVYLIADNQGQLIRTNEVSVEKVVQEYQEKYANKYRRMEEDERIYLEKSSIAYREEFVCKQLTPWVFYQIKEIRNYAKIVWDKYEESKNLTDLKAFWELYHIAEPYCWIEAEVYKYIALFYCAEQKLTKALEALRQAIIYGVFDMEEFFTHSGLELIKGEAYFTELKDYAVHNKPIGYKIPMQIETIEKILSLPQEMYTNGTLLWKYHLYDTVDIKEAIKQNPDLIAYWTRYIELNQQLFDRFFKRNNLIDMDYNPYEDYSCMPIEADIQMLNYYIQMMDVLSGSFIQGIPELVSRINKIKQRINQLEGEQQLYYKQLYNENVVVQVTQQHY